MMTPILEQLILTGQANVYTHNHGVGGVGAIQVPPGKTIVVTQIMWHPFVDVFDQETLQKELFLNSGGFFHTLKMRNKGKRYAFTFRDTLRSMVTIPGGGRSATTTFYPEKPIIIDTYLPFNEGTVDIDIMRMNNFSSWGVYSTTLPASSLEANPPEGYGNQASTNQFQEVNNVFYYGFVPPPWNPPNYTPPTWQRSGFQPTLSNEFEAFEPLVMPPNQFAPGGQPPIDSDMQMFPMVTFTYVLLNNKYIPGKPAESAGINPRKL